VISFLALMPAVFGQIGSGVATRVLAHPVPVRLGLISYGIFLWHYPVLVALNDLDATSWATSAQFPVMAIATFVLTVALSLITYYLLERPLMRWSRSRSKKRA
jgi:peptidoglycan/LPS O-acetylase OafA/YrhL